MENSIHLDYMIISQSAHAFFNTDVSKSVTEGDESSVLHVAEGHTLTMGNTLDCKTVVEDNGALDMAVDGGLTIRKPTLIYGTLKTSVDDDSVLFIESSLGLAPQLLSLEKLHIVTDGSLYNLGQMSPLKLKIHTLLIEGTFQADEVEQIDWQSFTVKPGGIVSYTPASHNEYWGSDILIEGEVVLNKTISITLPCDTFVINGGSLEMIGSEDITMECEYVDINGLFHPTGRVSVGGGITRFNVGPDGDFLFTTQGDFICHEAKIDGDMTHKTPVFLRGKIQDKLNSLIIGENGILTLDSSSQTLRNWTEHSTFWVNNMIVHEGGHALLGNLSVVNDDVSIGLGNLNVGGRFEFDPHNPFLCNGMIVNGHFESYKPITMKADDTLNVHLTIDVGESAEFIVDSDANHPTGPWTGQSYIEGSIFRSWMDSSVKLGDVALSISTVSWGGSVQLDCADFKTDDFTVKEDGHVEILHQVIIDAKSLVKERTNSITVSGYLKLDTAANHPSRSWSSPNGSIFNVDNVKVSGTMYAGLLSVGDVVERLTTSANSIMQYQALGIFIIHDCTINGSVKSYTPMERSNNHLQITYRLTISSEGELDMDFRGDTFNQTTGCFASHITANDVIIHGDLLAGSLTMRVDRLEVYGLIDVSGGGYLTEEGPGKT